MQAFHIFKGYYYSLVHLTTSPCIQSCILLIFLLVTFVHYAGILSFRGDINARAALILCNIILPPSACIACPSVLSPSFVFFKSHLIS